MTQGSIGDTVLALAICSTYSSSAVIVDTTIDSAWTAEANPSHAMVEAYFIKLTGTQVSQGAGVYPSRQHGGIVGGRLDGLNTETGSVTWTDAAPTLMAEDHYLLSAERTVTGSSATGAGISDDWSMHCDWLVSHRGRHLR